MKLLLMLSTQVGDLLTNCRDRHVFRAEVNPFARAARPRKKGGKKQTTEARKEPVGPPKVVGAGPVVGAVILSSRSARKMLKYSLSGLKTDFTSCTALRVSCSGVSIN